MISKMVKLNFQIWSVMRCRSVQIKLKAQRGIKSKKEAVSQIIEEFKELKKEEFNDKLMGLESAFASEQALAENWLSQEDEEAFASLQ